MVILGQHKSIPSGQGTPRDSDPLQLGRGTFTPRSMWTVLGENPLPFFLLKTQVSMFDNHS